MPKSIRILVIEDDPLQQRAISTLLEEMEYILIDVVSEIDEFRRLVRATVPDLLLMDIDLGAEMDGIELAGKVLMDVDIPIIFVSSFSDTPTVTRAIETYPAAYITKPYEKEALRAAIELAFTKSDLQPKQGPTSALLVKSGNVLKRIPYDDLLFVEVKGKNCLLATREGEFTLSMRLKDLLEKLPLSSFLQIHRSFIVNVDAIDTIDVGYQYVEIGETKVPVGRNYKEVLQKHL